MIGSRSADLIVQVLCEPDGGVGSTPNAVEGSVLAIIKSVAYGDWMEAPGNVAVERLKRLRVEKIHDGEAGIRNF